MSETGDGFNFLAQIKGVFSTLILPLFMWQCEKEATGDYQLPLICKIIYKQYANILITFCYKVNGYPKLDLNQSEKYVILGYHNLYIF